MLKARNWARASKFDEEKGSYLCFYRSSCGPCAIGNLIADEDYSPDFEGNGFDGLPLAIQNKLTGNLISNSFLRDLQSAHDGSPTAKDEEGNMERRMRGFAADRQLMIPSA